MRPFYNNSDNRPLNPDTNPLISTTAFRPEPVSSSSPSAAKHQTRLSPSACESGGNCGHHLSENVQRLRPSRRAVRGLVRWEAHILPPWSRARSHAPRASGSRLYAPLRADLRCVLRTAPPHLARASTLPLRGAGCAGGQFVRVCQERAVSAKSIACPVGSLACPYRAGTSEYCTHPAARAALCCRRRGWRLLDCCLVRRKSLLPLLATQRRALQPVCSLFRCPPGQSNGTARSPVVVASDGRWDCPVLTGGLDMGMSNPVWIHKKRLLPRLIRQRYTSRPQR